MRVGDATGAAGCTWMAGKCGEFSERDPPTVRYAADRQNEVVHAPTLICAGAWVSDEYMRPGDGPPLLRRVRRAPGRRDVHLVRLPPWHPRAVALPPPALCRLGTGQRGGPVLARLPGRSRGAPRAGSAGPDAPGGRGAGRPAAVRPACQPRRRRRPGRRELIGTSPGLSLPRARSRPRCRR